MLIMKIDGTKLKFLLTRVSGSLNYLKVIRIVLVICPRFHPGGRKE